MSSEQGAVTWVGGLMPEDQIREILVALAKLETKVDERFASVKESIDDLKGWKEKIYMALTSAIIVAVIGLLIGSGAVRIP